MDLSLALAVLLYFNVSHGAYWSTSVHFSLQFFYFAFFACLQCVLLVIKLAAAAQRYTWTAAGVDAALLLMSGMVEGARLYVGQQETGEKKGARLSLRSFLVLALLTSTSAALTFYSSFWQTHVTKLDAAFGLVLMLLQGSQLLVMLAIVMKNVFCNLKIARPFPSQKQS